ncbi:MAG: O-antigen ligase family protein [Lachnospiraceae bacterium]|nr:O-antigen ligase family protein [Lachnospiraceae bacterium]
MAIVLAIMIFLHYQFGDFKKWKVPYIIWTLVGGVGSIAVFLWGRESQPFLNAWIVVLVAIFLWGYIILHTFIDMVCEKKHPSLNKAFGGVWIVMMLWMIFSRSNYLWPLCYMVMFGCFYLTDFSEEEREDMLQGALDGIFLSVIFFQGFCCVFRPYDQVRYVGIYNNGNINALYYVMVLGAIFAKILYLRKKNARKTVYIFYWLSAGAVFSLLFMTIGRIGWITGFIIGLLFLVFLNIIVNKKKLVVNGIVLVLCTCLMFPACFCAVRYFPPVFHHPIWFWGEWREDKVHSWDPWDSEKFIDADEFFEAALGRIVTSIENLSDYFAFNTKIVVRAVEETEISEEVNVQIQAEVPSVETEDPRIAAAVLEVKDERDTILTRKTIYSHYINELNWTGHPYEEQGFQLTPIYWIGHAHNIYLQYGTDFGIPVMVLFAVMVIWGATACWKRGCKNKSIADMAAVFFILIPAIFGMLEYSWGEASLSITMLFLAWEQSMRMDYGS